MKPVYPHPEDQDHNAPPVNPLPVSVVLLALAIFGIEAAMTAADSGLIGGAGATGWRLAAIERFGFYQPLMDWMIETGTLRWDYVMRFVTYPSSTAPSPMRCSCSSSCSRWASWWARCWPTGRCW